MARVNDSFGSLSDIRIPCWGQNNRRGVVGGDSMTEPTDKSVSLWLAGLKEGDETAARLLWERYFDRLVHLARQQLNSGLRRVADDEDVALSVFDSLCKGAARGRFSELNDRDGLWRLLLTITRQKAVDQKRRETRQKRGGGKVRGESAFASPGKDRYAPGIGEFVGEKPTPAFLAQTNEHFQRLLGMLRDDTLRRVALARMEGYTVNEISEQLSVSPYSIERKLRLIRKKWSKELA